MKVFCHNRLLNALELLAFSGSAGGTGDEGQPVDGRAKTLRSRAFKYLFAHQNEGGSRVNPEDRWSEGDPALVTGYALAALALCEE